MMSVARRCQWIFVGALLAAFFVAEPALAQKYNFNARNQKKAQKAVEAMKVTISACEKGTLRHDERGLGEKVEKAIDIPTHGQFKTVAAIGGVGKQTK